MALHKAHRKVLDCIQTYLQVNSVSPTVQELQDKLGKSRGSIQNSLNRLYEAGLITWEKHKSRTIKLVEDIREEVEQDIRDAMQKGLPILGDIAAGYFHEPYTEAEDFLDISYPGQKETDYVLRVSGDSMINSGILDGAFVGIRPVLKDYRPKQGEIVALRVDGQGATLKHYYQKESIVVLEAANPDYEPMVFDLKTTEVTVHGTHIFTHWQPGQLR
ncbi:MAG: transcriptional repressor LexA [Cyanobacteria bacterium P01_C01_bin.69]